MKKLIWFLIPIIVLISLSGTLMSQVEEPSYHLIEKEGSFEIREYPPLIVAEVEVEGDRKEAINQGFRMLADYIFGNNTAVIQEVKTSNEKIAMTAPVTQQSNGKLWKVHFTMPKEYTLNTLPKPNSSAIKLIEVPKRTFAVLRFSGTPSEESLAEHIEELQKDLASKNIKTKGEPVFAFYNPPWTLPFLRRNEVMLEI